MKHERKLAALLLQAILALLFVLGLPGPASAQGVEVPLTPEGEPICVTCHSSVSLDIVRTWRSQNHGRAKVGCNVCHNSHEQEFQPRPTVALCKQCHPVEQIHVEFEADTPAARCMECHTANIHLLAGPESWFQGGLPPEKLESQPDEEGVSAGAGAAAGGVVVLIAVAVGLGSGFVLNRFVRGL